MRRFVAAAALLCLVFSSFAFSQGGNSQLGGIITDPSGALMPGVTITVTNVDTSIANTAISNESGAYNFPSLQPGTNYKVSASLPGFQTKTITSLNIGVAVTVRQDFKMEIASTATTVEVSIEANELLTTNSQSVGTVLSAKSVQDLPIVGNNVLSLIDLMPGVRGTTDNPVFAGVSEERINTVRDGLSVSDGRFQSGVFSTTFINPDLVGEVRIILTPVDAEMGRGNGQVIINTRSGTNKFTGNAQWDIRNTALNPNTWSNNRNVDPDTRLWSPTQPNWSNTHHITASYGGPIVRNKTFFFALWDQQLQYQKNITTATVMTDAARNGIFRFFPGWNNGNAQSATTITSTTTPAGGAGTTAVVDFSGNPLTPKTFPNGTAYTGQLTCISVFGTKKADGSAVTSADCPGGNLITGTWDSRRPVADPSGYIAKIIAKMPKANYFANGPTGADGLNIAGYRFLRTRQGNQGANVTIGTDTETNRKQINLKIDQNFSANHKLAVNWSDERNSTASDVPNWPDGIPYYTNRYPQVFTANMTSTLSSSLLNEGRFGVRYSNANIAGPQEEKYYPNKAGSDEAKKFIIQQSGYNVTLNPGAGNFNFGGTANGIFNTNPGQYNGNISYLYNYADTISWTQGKHAYKFGAEYRHTVSNGYNNIGAGGGVRIPFVRVNGGSDLQTQSELATIGSTSNGTTGGSLPNTVLAGTSTTGNRVNAVNMLYFLAGSVNNVQGLSWIDSADDVKNGTWDDVKTLGRKFRDTVQNEMSFFWKDDWKTTKNLTLNVGLRWDWFGSPYIGSGFTSTTVGQGLGLFGINQNASDPFAPWFKPGNLYLSGYGPNAGANALQCVSGATNPAGIPTSTCNPNNLTQIEFVGPKTPNPKKVGYPGDNNNFGPALGFSYNSHIFGENRPTTIRGGYQITFGGSGRVVGGGGSNATETVIGAAPGSVLNNDIGFNDLNEYLDLTDIAKLIPTPRTAPGAPIPVYAQANFSSVDPSFATPYTENLNFSVTTNATRKITVDLRYIGTFSRKQQTNPALNTNNIYNNPELFQALEITRAGGNAPLFDQMLAGLNLNSGVTTASAQFTGGPVINVNYGPIGTCVVQPTGSTTATIPGLGKEGCAANALMQHGSAHLRRNATFRGNIANGNYNGFAGSLMGNGSTLPTSGAGALQTVPTQIAGSVTNRRLLRNGCDRIAAGLYNPALAANNTTNIATRCFPEDYMVINPQLGNATLITNGGNSNYHSLQSQFTLRPTAGLSLQSTYTWSKNLGVTTSTPTNPLNRAADYTLLNNDRRHDIRVNSTFELPIGPNKLLLGNSSGWFARALERWQVATIYNWTSGLPDTIDGGTTLYANATPDIVGPFPFHNGTVRWNGDLTSTGLHGGTYFGQPNPFVSIDDPQCLNIVNVTDSSGYNPYVAGDCTINALAARNADGSTGQILLQTARPGMRGTLGQKTLEQPGRWSLDANISKTFRITESKSMQIRIDTTNVLNHPTPGSTVLGQPGVDNPVTTDSQSGNFGQITSTTGKTQGRAFQGTIRLTF